MPDIFGFDVLAIDIGVEAEPAEPGEHPPDMDDAGGADLADVDDVVDLEAHLAWVMETYPDCVLPEAIKSY